MADRFEQLATADLGEDVYATPAFVGPRIYIRGFPNRDMAPVAASLERQFIGPFQSDVLDYRAQRIEQQAHTRKAKGESAVLAEIEKGAREMLAEYPHSFVPGQLLLKVARQLEPDPARKLAAEVRETKNLPDFVKEEAAELLKKLDRILRDLNARLSLDEKVTKLLAETP